jgi:hypothetical protein
MSARNEGLRDTPHAWKAGASHPVAETSYADEGASFTRGRCIADVPPAHRAQSLRVRQLLERSYHVLQILFVR